MMETEGRDRKRAVLALRACMLLMVGVLIVVPVLLANREPGAISEADNRELQDFPQFSANVLASGSNATSFFSSISGYASDRIGLRNEMMASFSLLNDRMFGVMVHPLYEYGTDGYVFAKFTDHTYDEEYVTAFADYILKMQEFCEARGIPFLYVISPEKSRVYAEYVPDYASNLAHSSDVLIPLLEERGVNYLDQGVALAEAKERGVQVFNVAYDAGHWNTEGMYAGSQAIIDKLQEMGVVVDDIDIDEYEKIYSEHTKLPSSNYPIHATTYKYKIRNGIEHAAKQDSDYNDGLVLDPSYKAASYYTSSQDSECSVLIFQGSYFNGQGTMLQNQFSEWAAIHDYMNVFNLPYYFNVYQPDVVIFENADYTVKSGYYSLDGLLGTELPNAYASYDSYRTVMCDDEVSLVFDTSKNIASTYIAWPVDGPPVDSVYILIDGDVSELAQQADGTYLWGAVASNYDGTEEVLLVGVNESQGVKYLVSCILN